MKHGHFSFSITRGMLYTLLVWFAVGVAVATDDECGAVGEYGFVCGPVSAEDLVLVVDHWKRHG
jgi:hypothetical protein